MLDEFLGGMKLIIKELKTYCEPEEMSPTV